MAKKKNPHIGRSLDEFIVAQRAKDPADADRLRRSEPAAADRARDGRQWRISHLVPGREARTQIGICAVAVRVAGVLRQHREDELVQGREAARRRRRAIDLAQTERDGAKTSPHPTST